MENEHFNQFGQKWHHLVTIFPSIPNAKSWLQCLYRQKLAFLSCMSHGSKYWAILWEMVQYLEMGWSYLIWLTYQIYYSYWRLKLFTNMRLPNSKSKKVWFSWLPLSLNTRQKWQIFPLTDGSDQGRWDPNTQDCSSLKNLPRLLLLFGHFPPS